MPKSFPSVNPPTRATAWHTALELATGYVVVAALWILISDEALRYFGLSGPQYTWVQMLKGWAFIGVTGLLLAFFVYRRTRALESVSSNYRSIFRASPLPVITLDREGKVLSWNPAAEATFGWTEAEVLGKPDPTIVGASAGEVPKSTIGQTFAGINVQQRRKDGSLIDVALAMAPFHSPEGEIIGVVIICEDVTMRKRAELLERQRATTQESIRAMEEAIGVIGHELRTPLASLRLMSEQLAQAGGLSADDRQSFARSINAEIQRLTEMANNMLDAARGSSHAPRFTFRRFSVTDVVHDAAEILIPLTDATRVQLDFRVSPPDLTVLGDSDALRRLLINLISNAQKHTPRGRIDVELRPVAESDIHWLEVSVNDTGRGLPAEVVRRLGEPFNTGGNVVGPLQLQGVGLGLVIVKSIVAAHGGSISVVTHPGKGTRVLIRLRADLPAPLVNARADIHCQVLS